MLMRPSSVVEAFPSRPAFAELGHLELALWLVSDAHKAGTIAKQTHRIWVRSLAVMHLRSPCSKSIPTWPRSER